MRNSEIQRRNEGNGYPEIPGGAVYSKMSVLHTRDEIFQYSEAKASNPHIVFRDTFDNLQNLRC